MKLELAGPLALAIAGLLVGEASAHAHLASASPAANATVRVSPRVVRIVFSEPVVARFSGLDLVDGAGRKAPLAKAVADPADPRALTAAVTAPLTAGAYTVNWRVVSKDTHRITGTYRFKVAP